MPEIWMPAQLDAIERTFPTPEVKSLVAEIRRLNVIARRAHDVMLAADAAGKQTEHFFIAAPETPDIIPVPAVPLRPAPL